MINDLLDLTGSDDVDLLDLGRAGPVAREQALVHGEPLYEATTGEYANAALKATMERLDTLDLRLMAEPAE